MAVSDHPGSNKEVKFYLLEVVFLAPQGFAVKGGDYSRERKGSLVRRERRGFLESEVEKKRRKKRSTDKAKFGGISVIQGIARCTFGCSVLVTEGYFWVHCFQISTEAA
ncbi:hypothetical protein CCACVL1_22611 [Corchorus capsularis]|uniref:Uncharacterized protein n=1 Tax=Corchorus capsularis TaxID=210143 RepID=A0A1R3GXS5_COCAP|nr:hypothetical protein CCACVL1_22611 [Corchorus capsularis]